MFIQEAIAETGAEATSSFASSPLPMFILIFVVFYLLIWRPQSQRMKQHQEVLSNLSKGDAIVTDSGIYGTVVKVIDDIKVVVEVAEGVQLTVVKNAVSAVVEDKFETTKPAAKAEKKSQKKSKKKAS